MQAIFYNSTIMVGVSFFLFLALLWYLGVHKMLAGMLDKRAEGIRNELDEARKLREEAQELFADFERKQKEVEEQSKEIVEHAKVEAEAAAERAKADIAASIERRLKAADDQIALAEQNAVKEVKDKAVSVAIAAATEVLSSNIGAKEDKSLVEAAIKDVGAKLH